MSLSLISDSHISLWINLPSQAVSQSYLALLRLLTAFKFVAKCQCIPIAFTNKDQTDKRQTRGSGAAIHCSRNLKRFLILVKRFLILVQIYYTYDILQPSIYIYLKVFVV